MNQKTIVERMKPLYPGLTAPIYSAVVRKRAGIQWTAAFLRDAEEKGVEVRHDKDGRYFRHPFKCRLTDEEAAEFVRERRKVLNEMREWAGKWNDLWILLYVGPNKAIVPEIVTNGEFTRGEMRFATREDAENCIRAVGGDRIIKYYFEISQEEKK